MCDASEFPLNSVVVLIKNSLPSFYFHLAVVKYSMVVLIWYKYYFVTATVLLLVQFSCRK